MESSHLVIFSTSGKFITKFNVLRSISLSETLFWTGARDRIQITLRKLDAEIFEKVSIYKNVLSLNEPHLLIHSLILVQFIRTWHH